MLLVGALPQAGAASAVPAFDATLDEVADVQAGVRRRLDERDVLLTPDGALHEWRAVEYTIANRLGLDTHGRYALPLQPSRDRLQVHRIDVRRAGAVSSRLADTRQQRVPVDAATGDTLSDRHRLSLLIPDLIIGDTVRIVWTRTRAAGANPMPPQIGVALDASAPLARRVVRVRWPRGTPLRVRGGRVPMSIAVNATHRVHTVVQQRVAERGTVPRRLIFSAVRGARDMAAAWAPHFAPAAPAPADVLQAAQRIRERHGEPGDRAAAALQWVQGRVRYQAVHLGDGAWQPNSAAQTLSLGYGDCKDVTVLLLTLLHALDIDAQAALTQRDPASLGVDHVLVHARIGERAAWLDATLTHQRGGLDDLSMPAGGQAVLLDSAERVDMATPAPATPQQDSVRQLTPVADGWQLSLRSDYRRAAAERLRALHDAIGEAGLERRWRQVLAKRFGSDLLMPLAPLQYSDSPSVVTLQRAHRLSDDVAPAALVQAGPLRDALAGWQGSEALDLRERIVITGGADWLAADEARHDAPGWWAHRRVAHAASGDAVIDYRVRSDGRVDVTPAFAAHVDAALAMLDGEQRRPTLAAALPPGEAFRPAVLIASLIGIAVSTLAFALAGLPSSLGQNTIRRP